MKKIFVLGLLVFGLASRGHAETPQMKACRAAYESLEPWKVFDACGQLVADGEQPQDANVWDWLMLAQVYVDDTEPNWGNIRNLREQSLKSGQRTGSAAFDIIERTKDESIRKQWFAAARAFGPWFNAYARSRETGDWDAYYKFRKKLKGGKESERWDAEEMRRKVREMVEAKKWDEALRLSAALVVFAPTVESYALRGDVQSAAGNDLFAAFNYQTASRLIQDAVIYLKYSDKELAARASFREKRGASKPQTLLEMLSPMASYVREKGNLEPKFSSIGLRTQWQADGALRIWTNLYAGFYLLPDGANFQKALEDGKRGAVESPRQLPSGKRIYPMGGVGVAWFPPDTLPWTPLGSFYFGAVIPLARESEGFFVRGDEYNRFEAPFVGGQPYELVKEVSRVVDYGKTTVTYTDGLVVATQPRRQARIDVPGSGWFQGDIKGDFLPYTGVITRDDGLWTLVYEGVIRSSEKIGNAVYLTVDRDSGVKLNPNGDVVYLKQVGDDQTIITWPASGEERVKSEKTIEYDWRASEAARQKYLEKEAQDELYRQGMSYQPQSTVQSCSRCNGTGRVWQSGGASQERVSAPSGSSASQREDFYNSAASVRTTYSSGSMSVCPACNGTGRQ